MSLPPRDFAAKADQGKTDWTLLPWRAIEKAAEIMTLAITPKAEGGEGYGLDSWRTVPGGFHRYGAALMRHWIRRFVFNEVIDPKSGKPHTSHMICNAAFVCEKDTALDNGELTQEEIANFYERDI